MFCFKLGSSTRNMLELLNFLTISGSSGCETKFINAENGKIFYHLDAIYEY